MSTFDYRRRLERKELLMLAGGVAGAGAGLATVLFYLGRIWLQKVPLEPEARPARAEGPRPDPALETLAAGIVQKDAVRR
jgi:hypothetical protein